MKWIDCRANLEIKKDIDNPPVKSPLYAPLTKYDLNACSTSIADQQYTMRNRIKIMFNQVTRIVDKSCVGIMYMAYLGLSDPDPHFYYALPIPGPRKKGIRPDSDPQACV